MMRNSISNKGKDDRKGFTLLEVIVSIVIMALLGSMVVTYFGTSLLESSTPILRLKKSTDLQRVMANINANYKKYPVWKKNSPYRYDDIVIPTPYHYIGQRFYYKCTTPPSGGGPVNSRDSEPAWSGSGTVNDGATLGTLVWAYQGTLPTLADLKTSIGDDDHPTTKKYDYGQDGKVCVSDSDCASGSLCKDEATLKRCKFGYYVIENKYITFDASNNEQEVTSGDILKVSIKNDSGEILSALFF
jgi:prepilin-type N-terminal cleavage/methylation domain-containing protein